MKRLTFLTLCLLLIANLAHGRVKYQIRDLGLGKANAMNDAHQVVGVHQFSTSLYSNHAFLWSAETGMVDIGNTDPTIAKSYSEARGINEAGQIAGYYSPGNPQAFVWDHPTGFRLLGLLPGTNSSAASGINGGGQVAGGAYASYDDSWASYAFFWSECLMSLIPELPWQKNASAAAINDCGQVVGYSNFTSGHGSIAWLREPDGRVRDLGNLPGGYGRSAVAVAINNRGEVTGSSSGRLDISGAYIWSARDGMRSIGRLPGHTYSSGKGINDRGEIVGYSEAQGLDEYPFFWSLSTGMVELPRLRNYPTVCNDINNAGEIVGYARTWDGSHAVLWSPVIDIQVDVKPNDSSNTVNLRSNGVVPVAVLTTAEFNASDVAQDSVVLAGAKAVRWHLEDVNGDGDLDLLLFFRTSELKLAPGEMCVLTGSTTSGAAIEGADNVTIVPPVR